MVKTSFFLSLDKKNKSKNSQTHRTVSSWSAGFSTPNMSGHYCPKLTLNFTLNLALSPFKHTHKRQTIGATNHFLHVSCHRFDPAAQSIVLSNNLWVVLHPKPWKKTETLIYYTVPPLTSLWQRNANVLVGCLSICQGSSVFEGGASPDSVCYTFTQGSFRLKDKVSNFLNLLLSTNPAKRLKPTMNCI